MYIDPRSHTLVPLHRVPDLPWIPSGGSHARPRKICRTTVYRWASRGIRGIVLPTLRVGGQKVTSEEALVDWLNRVSDRDAPSQASPTRRRRQQRTSSKLDQHNVR